MKGLVSTIYVRPQGTTCNLRLAYGSPKEIAGLIQQKAVPVNGTPSGHVMTTEHTLTIGDIAAETRFPIPDPLAQDDMKSLVLTPLMDQGKAIGTIGLFSQRSHAYGNKDRHILETVATQIGPAVLNARRFREFRHLAMALESVGDAVISLDSAGTVEYVNCAAQEILGYAAPDLVGNSLSILCPGVVGDRESLPHMLKDMARCGGTRRGQVRWLTKSGRDLDLQLTCTPVTDREEGAMSFVVVAT